MSSPRLIAFPITHNACSLNILLSPIKNPVIIFSTTVGFEPYTRRKLATLQVFDDAKFEVIHVISRARYFKSSAFASEKLELELLSFEKIK